MSDARERTYSDEEVESRLAAELPSWYLHDGHIRRRIETHGWKSTLMAINAIGHLCEVAWHHPEIAASYGWLVVGLQNHSAGGITDKDFELARKIEDLIMWRPATEGGALEGTPEDARFAYLKYNV